MENSSQDIEINFGVCDNSKFLRLSDGKLLTEDGCSFPIHKFILAKSSKYFVDLFCRIQKGKEDILIPSIKGEHLKNILCYLYTGRIHVTERNIFDIMAASVHFLLDDLLFKLKQFLRENLTVTNSVSILKISLELNRDDFSRECFRFIQTHFENVVRCENSQIFDLPLDTLKVLLGDKNLRISSENIVWLAIIKWIESDIHNRLPLVPDLLKHLAISDIDDSLADEILQHDIVASNPSCQDICQLKSLISDASNVTTLKSFFQTCIRHLTDPSDHRQPSKLNLIVHHKAEEWSDTFQVYVTFDENIDLWRTLCVIDEQIISRRIPIFRLRIQFLLVDDCIYMFELDTIRILYYNIIKKVWNNLVSLKPCHEVVTLDGRIYVFEGCSTDGEPVYDSETGEWDLTPPMFEVVWPVVVTYNNIIYVVGIKPFLLGGGMVAQAYDPSTATWNLLPSPSIFREDFTMVVFRDMIYIIGGKDNEIKLKDVEVFDPIKKKWSKGENLPHVFYRPKAVTVMDKLIVYDRPCPGDSHINISPSIQWNARQKCWEKCESSFLKDLHMYSFFTLENSECINVISRENKDPATHFENSRFS